MSIPFFLKPIILELLMNSSYIMALSWTSKTLRCLINSSFLSNLVLLVGLYTLISISGSAMSLPTLAASFASLGGCDFVNS